MKLAKVDPYHFAPENIPRIEGHYSAKYLGYWCIKLRSGAWSDMPVDVFYQANPDVSLGHSHYFGLYIDQRTGGLMICDAKSAFSEPIVGVVDNDVVYVSRYRHDYIKTPNGYVIDGGRDYTRTSMSKDINVVHVYNSNGEFYFK